MKTASDPRHLKRIRFFKALFSTGFDSKDKIPSLIQPIFNHLSSIDKLITQHAPEWPIAKLNKVDLAILRLAIYELTIEKKNPPKVIIDEAIELAKKFGTDKTSKFVNGVLGAVLNQKWKKFLTYQSKTQNSSSLP